MKYETRHYFRSQPDSRRAGTPPARSPFDGRLYLASLPDPAGQCVGPSPRFDRPQPRLHAAFRPQCHPRLRGRRVGLSEGEVLPSPQRPTRAGCRLRRTLASPVAPESAGLRQAPQHLDVGPGGPGLPRQRLGAPRAEPRHHPPGHPAVGRFLATRQALDHQPRPRLRAKKKHATG